MYECTGIYYSKQCFESYKRMIRREYSYCYILEYYSDKYNSLSSNYTARSSHTLSGLLKFSIHSIRVHGEFKPLRIIKSEDYEGYSMFSSYHRPSDSIIWGKRFY